MRILVTSDNHLGFKETDNFRSDDSFNTFDEILFIAKRENVDMIFQGGDLFHENKPSRNTYNKTIAILKKYCLGNTKPNFTSSIKMNTDDKNMSVSLPIFSIHGNHDDPSGFNSISPLDILHSGGFINYFGRVDNVDNIELDPILIEGNRKIALYGMGHIKDRRVYKTFLKRDVKYLRPVGDSWINILMVHQNRTPRKEEYLPEDFIDSFFDLVIYGHEHESIKIRHKSFDVIQCGSTVRTSLCDGELGDKFVYLIDISEKMHLSRIKLATVRQFYNDTIKVNAVDALQIIRRRIEDLVTSASSNSMLPLLRLRIEIEDGLDFNKHQLIALLDGKIANIEDAIKITRKVQKQVIKGVSKPTKTDVVDLYASILEGCDLKALQYHRVLDSLLDFLNKDCKEAFNNLIKDGMANIISNVNFEDLISDNIDMAIKNARERILKEDKTSFRPKEIEESGEEIVEQLSQMCKSVSLPQESISFQTSSINMSKGDYTFLEEKLENIREKEILENIRTEFEQKTKKTKFEDDSDDLLQFTKYI
ncbi:hypothetical protein GINT2_001648 [Glugoides intestinalis]